MTHNSGHVGWPVHQHASTPGTQPSATTTATYPEMKQPIWALRSKSVSGRCGAHSGAGASASATLPRAAMARLIAAIAAASTSCTRAHRRSTVRPGSAGKPVEVQLTVSVGGLGLLELRDRRPLRPPPGVGVRRSAALGNNGARPEGNSTVRRAFNASATRARRLHSHEPR